MYVILARKDGRFRTEPLAGVRIAETYSYHHGKRLIATYMIAEAECGARVKIVDVTPPETASEVRVKFFERFQTVDQARASLHHLVETRALVVTLTLVA